MTLVQAINENCISPNLNPLIPNEEYISKEVRSTTNIVNAIKSLSPIKGALSTGICIFDHCLNVEYASPEIEAYLYPNKADIALGKRNISKLLLSDVKKTDFYCWQKKEVGKMINKNSHLVEASDCTSASNRNVFYQSEHCYIGKLPFQGSVCVSCCLTLVTTSNCLSKPLVILSVQPTAEQVMAFTLAKVAAKCRFSSAEEEIAKFLLEGYSNREIAVKRSVSTETVKSQVQSVLGKVGSSRRSVFAHKIYLLQAEIV